MASTISAGTSASTAIAIAGDTSGALALQTNNGTTAVTITTAQNVGIGNTSPAAKLQVTSATSGATPDTNADELVVEGSGQAGISILAGSGQSGRLYFGSSAGSAQGIIRYDNASNFFQFATNNTDAMRIDSSGNVLLGTTSVLDGGTYRLQIKHDGERGIITNSTGTSLNYSMIFQNGNGTVGNINTSGSATAYATSSDYRLKDDVQPMTGALNTVSALKPVTYKWKNDGSDGQGFIAHELQEVVPDCVTGTKDGLDKDGNPEYQGIDTSFLVATLTAAIQELNAKVDAQAAEIAALKGA
jgi:hypothetical protein